MDRVQCCVVGGGPAGVMAGALLARSGVETLVLEKHGDFLRDFRGDTIHPSTLQVLDELGWLDDFLARPHQELKRLAARIEGVDITVADFSHVPGPRKAITFVPQWDFLSFVVEKARAFPKFAIAMRTAATDLVEEEGHVVGVRVDSPDGPRTIRAGLVIAADGRRSLLRERAGFRVSDLGAPMDVLWMRIPRREGDPIESLGWICRGRFLALINRGDYWQVAFLIRKGGFAEIQAAGIEAFRRMLAETAPLFADRVDALRSFDDVKLLVVKVDHLERWWKPGLLCIGDCAHAMSPIGGVGINLAIQDAVAAANILAEPLRRGSVSDADLARVQRRRELPARATQALQIFIQRRVIDRVLSDSRPLRVARTVRLISRSPLLQRVPAHLMGVGFRPEHVKA